MRLSYRLRNASGRFVFVFGRTLGVLAALLVMLSTAKAVETTVRVRIAFGAGGPQQWQGKITAEGGSLSGLQSLAMTPEAVGDVWLTPEGVTVQHDTPIGREALDVTLTGEADARLIAHLTFPDKRAPLTAEFTLKQLRSGESQAVQGPNGSRFIAQRLPDDRLRIELDRKNLLFEPGETLALDVVADPAGVEPGGSYDFSVELFEGRDGESVWRGETQRIDAPLEGLAKLPVSIPLPSQEGVYRIQLRVARPVGFVDRFRAKSASQTLHERTFQVVVFDRSAPVAAPGDWQETYTFEPASPRWRDRLPAWTGWRRLRGAEVGPLSSQTGQVVHAAKEGFVEIAPAPEKNAAHWQAYPLAVQRPGEPCLIEVEYPIDTPQQLGLSVMDMDSDGTLRPLGDAVVTETPRWGRSGKMAVARFVCWPRTEEPMLVLHNPDANRTARFGKVRVSQTSPIANQRSTPTDGNFVTLDFTNPHLAESVGAVLAGEQAKDDLWQFYETARRLADRVQLAGAGGAVVAVNGQGGAIFPSTVHGNAPIYTSGVWQSGTNDLPQQALLELLLGEFDRRGLKLTTSLRFDAPLPMLERELRQNDQPAPRWISDAGEVHRSLRYNVLDLQVQEAMLAGTSELVRYGTGHPSFGGVVLRIGPNSGPLLPGDAWGYDTVTVDRFLESAGLRWPPGIARSPEAYAAAIAENASDEWHVWRYAQLAGFQQRTEELTGGKLLLLGDSLNRMAPLREATTPRLGSPRSVKRALDAVGLTPPAGSEPALAASAPSATWSLGLNRPLASFAATTESSDRLRAALLESSSSPRTAQIDTDRWECRLYNFARWLKMADDAVLSCTAAPSQGEVTALAEAFAYGVSETIADGGPVTSGWQDEQAESLRRLLADLPKGILSGPASASHENVLARVITGEDSSHLVVINTSSWQREVQLSVGLDDRCLGTPLNDQSTPAEWYDAGQHVLQANLQPGEAKVWRFSGRGLKIQGVRLQNAPDVREELAEQIAVLRRRDRTARRAYAVIANPSFESIDASSRPLNWHGAPASAVGVASSAYDGNLCLELRSNSEKAVATSDPFPRPTTGQLAIVFQATGRNLSDDAQLQIAVEEDSTGRAGGDAYHVHTTVSAASLAVGEAGTGWRELVFAMDDLPLGGDTPLRLRFMLSGKGEVRIDDLRVEDLKLPLDSYAEELRPQKLALVRMVHAAERALEDERYADCQRLLDSYWSRFLTEHFPLEKTPPPIAQEVDDAATTASDEEGNSEDAPSVADRFRRYLPSMWR